MWTVFGLVIIDLAKRVVEEITISNSSKLKLSKAKGYRGKRTL